MKINDIKKQLKNDVLDKKFNTLKEVEDIKIKYLGKDGFFNQQMQYLKTLNKDELKIFAIEINELKKETIAKIENESKEINLKVINQRIENEKIDCSINTLNKPIAAPHIISKTIDEILNYFVNCGFKIIDGPEVESDYYCFEQVNIPKDHIARDMQDTFYFDENILLRTHTSSNQIREMEKNKDKNLQLAIVSPGKVYRRDTDDATHSHQFTQIEGMLIDKNINLGNLKAVLEGFIKALFGENRKIRLRTSYFPFTEPSVEVDVSCGVCDMKGCNTCKQEGWIEILGAGMIHRNVLKNGGYDPNKVSGFAFGVGIERIAMLKYNIKDIRYLYCNDVEILSMLKGETF